MTERARRTSGANTRTQKMILTALFAALTAVGAWISIPLPFTPVPVTLATLMTTLAGGLLGYKHSTLSMIVYLLVGAVGAPVFHNFTGGLGILTGPTGGYLVGYITSALICGLLITVFCRSRLTWWGVAIAAVIGLATCYALGTIWFMASSGTSLAASMVTCVIPFLPGDVLKTILAVVLIMKLRPRVYGVMAG